MNRRQTMLGLTALGAGVPFVAACAPPAVTSADPAKFVDGVRLAELIASGDLTPLEAVEAAIARAEAVEPQINAIANQDYDAARKMAGTSLSGAFAGVPSFIKDLADSKDLPTLFGSRAFVGNLVPEDGPLAAAFRAQGIVPLGKSTSPEMGLISSTEPLVTGPTRNPWDVTRSPGGSSGGAAALVAAGVVPFAHASDGGGSIRIPASVCGLVGLKPSARRIPPGRTNQLGAPVEISMDLAVSRTVRDQAMLFAALAVGDEARPVTGPAAERLTIGYAPDPTVADITLDPEVRAELDATAALCEQLGHTVKPVTLPIDGAEFSDKFLLYWAAGAANFAQQAASYTGKPISPEILEPWTISLAQMFLGRRDELEGAIAYLRAFRDVYSGWFTDLGIDLLLTPTVSRPAVPIGEQAPDRAFEPLMQSVMSFAAYTAPMNVSGGASLSVPLGQTASGLPIGSMFSGRIGDDEKLLALAYELEAARPWIDRTPPVWAFG